MSEHAQNVPCALLEWDSAFWGFPIARRLGAIRTDAESEAITAWCDRHAIRCLYVLTDVNEPVLLPGLESNGYKLIDERVTLLWSNPSQAPTPPTQLPESLVLRSSVEDDVPALQAIAAESHIDTRFFTDDRFPREQAHALYAHWIAESCKGFADTVFVASLEGSLVGYCSCHRSSSPASPGSIGLVAVAPTVRGRGVGRALVQQALRWFVEQGEQHVVVITQGHNDAALRLYQDCGFTVDRRQHWSHWWFAERIDEA